MAGEPPKHTGRVNLLMLARWPRGDEKRAKSVARDRGARLSIDRRVPSSRFWDELVAPMQFIRRIFRRDQIP